MEGEREDRAGQDRAALSSEEWTGKRRTVHRVGSERWEDQGAGR